MHTTLSIKKYIKNGIVLLILGLALSAKGVTIDPDFEFIVENETYKVYQTMDFSSITIATSYIIFNSTGFYLNSGNDIEISLVYLNGDITNAGDGEKIVEFYATTASGEVWFDISGFVTDELYEINRDGSPIDYSTADNDGYISFSNDVWSTQLFTINHQGASPGDSEPPDISAIAETSSNPVDTQTDFGWENITCIVTDDVEVNQVFVKFIYPDSSQNSVSMDNIDGTNNYYYNTSLNIYGNYSYYIWANDTSDNTAFSSHYYISLPPNWDINKDGVCNVIDQVLASNYYGANGNPGWIREDVDNNGEIQVFDFVLISNYYGSNWWEV